ncbi:hypothetical protein GCM10010946_09000 [Undibacterium squillarum]|uniref:Transporter n=2 Tax=Undibacterium squillarum TaxID=1131567 RepID=A0ABQ2XV20_9BURK|nr:hypothetical protein GCM10010946_09000 [Undibacterium squillarum]
MTMRLPRWLALAAVTFTAAYATQAQASCGASFCLVNTDWGMQGAWQEKGWRADFRYEQLLQNRLRSGTDAVLASALDPSHRETESLTRRWVSTLDYGWDEHWSASVTLPFIDREHRHIEDSAPASWHYRQFGDAKVSLRYQTNLHDSDETLGVGGLHAGLKLPSGRTGVRNSTGTLAERALQPGSGGTGLLLSAYYRQFIAPLQLSWFVQLNADLPLNTVDGFKAGRQTGLDLGLSRPLTSRITGLLQLNLQQRGRDAGAQAEPEASGGRSAFLSPGISVSVAPQTRVYGFVQLPLYQYVNGQQLTARYAFALGAQTRF